uniref:Uncharacterized protein n=1 Tax=Salarias fasciatus TaxID=181472 RepID=A0A672GLN0_SALFA
MRAPWKKVTLIIIYLLYCFILFRVSGAVPSSLWVRHKGTDEHTHTHKGVHCCTLKQGIYHLIFTTCSCTCL